MPPDGMLPIIEMAQPGGQSAPNGNMPREYAALLDKAGLRLCRVMPIESAASIVEAVQA
jgi:hypothetical protein